MYKKTKAKFATILFITSLSVLFSNVECHAPIRHDKMHIKTAEEMKVEIKIEKAQAKEKQNVKSKKVQVKTKKVKWKDIYRLAQLMYSENGSAKEDECVVLTGIVVMKRVKSKHYPNTIEGVISQKGQYATYMNGYINCEPDERCLELAEEILRFDLQKYYPNNLVFQSQFKQGKEIYAIYGNEYFCLA